eukprot:scpid107040/ scgid14673/ 
MQVHIATKRGLYQILACSGVSGTNVLSNSSSQCLESPRSIMSLCGKKSLVLCTCRDRVDGEERRVDLLQTSVEAIRNAGLPRTLPPRGITEERQQYLFTSVRQHVDSSTRIPR